MSLSDPALDWPAANPFDGFGGDPKPAATLLRGLANPHRLEVLCTLYNGEQPVAEIARVVGLSQSALSQHLARLRRDGVVAARRQGLTMLYRIVDPDVMTLLTALSGVMARRRGRQV